MMRQEQIFLDGEGDQYHDRNFRGNVETRNTEILRALWRRLPSLPTAVLEIGCGAGGNLEFLRRHTGAACYGLDPSAKAIEEGTRLFPELSLEVGTASRLPYEDGFFECVIFGFCLYLCDRGDLFTIAREADRVLRNGGALVIVDFNPSFPYRNPYKHLPGLYAYKMPYQNMFLWNPVYSLAEFVSTSHSKDMFDADPDERIAYAVLHKADVDAGYPINPYGKEQ